MPVARLVADTAAPTITAPLGSVTVPIREPVAPVATHNLASSESPAANPSNKRLIPPSLLPLPGCWLRSQWSPVDVRAAHTQMQGRTRRWFRAHAGWDPRGIISHPVANHSIYSSRSFTDCVFRIDGAIVARSCWPAARQCGGVMQKIAVLGGGIGSLS